MRVTEVHDDLVKEKDFLGQRVVVHKRANYIPEREGSGMGVWRGN